MKYICKCCNYTCSRKSLWEQHISTLKHMKNSNIEIPLDYNINKCNICNKIYKSRSGLWKHQKYCKSIKIENKLENKIDNNDSMLDILVFVFSSIPLCFFLSFNESCRYIN